MTESIINIENLFPSEDGNDIQRNVLLNLIEQVLLGIDQLKDSNRASLKGNKIYEKDFYANLMKTSEVPIEGIEIKEIINQLLVLLHSHPYQNKYYLTNVFPMASIPSIMGLLVTALVNGNNLWDVYAPAGAETEVKVVAMLSKLIGYDSTKSSGYTTWGGQGAVFTGLRIAISKHISDVLRLGIPKNLYAFCSDAAHYSLFKSMEATGIGSENLIKVRTLPDSSMDLIDLKNKMIEVIQKGGIPIYLVATMGTTDALGIDDLKGIYDLVRNISSEYAIEQPYIHADSAIGGFFTVFNEYDFEKNILNIPLDTVNALCEIQKKLSYLYLADSVCFDFHKLGQAPYATSLFIVKKATDLKFLDLVPEETPYVGYREYGQYHTGYTLECSRMSSAIIMYSTLLGFGVRGYQQLLSQLVTVNIEFRNSILRSIPNATIVNINNPGITTLIRVYPEGKSHFKDEIEGKCTKYEVEKINKLNERIFEQLGKHRSQIFFGDTKKHLLVSTIDNERIPLSAVKIFVISPYTQVHHVEKIVKYLKNKIDIVI